MKARSTRIFRVPVGTVSGGGAVEHAALVAAVAVGDGGDVGGADRLAAGVQEGGGDADAVVLVSSRPPSQPERLNGTPPWSMAVWAADTSTVWDWPESPVPPPAKNWSPRFGEPGDEASG
ncbi:hypothetical protein [Kitasatospora paracochleata]|uniref:Uncharacterized protein n=1 Tax=Kitasatospora paracochleata TaxID=58354 RepID=A0ABT1JB33_9ACTN|nr:hypothetical protein [Kitasatospora paracochleata]MCP2314661.1 hypothetical protein [Kitasatospora paracochleata]